MVRSIHSTRRLSNEEDWTWNPFDLLKQRNDSTDIGFRNHDLRTEVPREVYILGTGNIGKLIAHALSGIPNPPLITLLLHSESSLRRWRQEGHAIKLISNGFEEARTSYRVELTIPRRSSENYEKEEELFHSNMIHNLIVTTKAVSTVAALTSIKHRLSRESTICFLQNGMGIVDEVNEKLFRDVETRPNYMLGITSHGVYSEKFFTAVHAGFGTTSVGLLSRYPLLPKGQNHATRSNSSRYLLRTITRTPLLVAVAYSQTDLLQLQLEKLAINAIINPLSVIFGCRNGDLLFNFAISRVMRLLLFEISLIIRGLPELKGLPNVESRFSTKRLQTLVYAVARDTSENLSSMLQDARKGKETEIDYINGYIVKRGEEMGIKCAMNYMVQQMVKGKQHMLSMQIDDYIPVVKEQVLQQVHPEAKDTTVKSWQE